MHKAKKFHNWERVLSFKNVFENGLMSILNTGTGNSEKNGTGTLPGSSARNVILQELSRFKHGYWPWNTHILSYFNELNR